MPLSDQARAFLYDLMATHSPAGDEAAAQTVVRDYLGRRLGDAVHFDADRADNLIAMVRPDASPRVALLGHVDTIGLIVTGIDAGGLVRVGMIGRPRAEALVSHVVTIRGRGGEVGGVVVRRQRGDAAATVDDLAIDTGLPAGEVRARVRIGDTVSWARRPIELGGRIVGPATDNRAGIVAACEALIAAADGDGPCVSAVSAIQEEGPTRLGAKMTMARLRPDLVVVLDTTGADGERVRLGGGPVVARGGSNHNATSDALLDLAESMGIPAQIEPVGRASGTDLEAALAAAGGSAVGVLVSIPHTHYHTPNEMLDPADLAATIELVGAFVRDLPDVL